MTREKRPYRMRKRAEREQQTRQRITESAVALHGTLGPSRTSISAVAEHAGVRRSTVYRHFPTETHLYNACATHWLAANPVPDLRRWAKIGTADERLQTALRELYAYYRGTQQMMASILRDEDTMPIVKQTLIAYRQFLVDAQATLMEGRQLRGTARRHVRAAIGHALAFNVWRTLAVEQGLDDAESADLMCLLVRTVAGADQRTEPTINAARHARQSRRGRHKT